MKKVLITMILTCLSFGSFANIMEKVFVDQNEMLETESVITSMYEEEISKKNSVIRGQILGLMSGFTADEVTFITNNDFDLSDDEFYNEKIYLGKPVLVGSGRSGVAYHGAEYIVPIMASSPGTGMIQETIAFLKVTIWTSFYDVENDKEELKETFTFTKLATLKDL